MGARLRILLACEILVCRIDVRCECDNSLDGNRSGGGAKYSIVLLSKSTGNVQTVCNVL